MSKKKPVHSGTPTTGGKNAQTNSKARRKAKGKTNVVWHQTAEEATLAAKPHYNGFACGHGAHGDYKYNRAKAKRTWKNQIRQEGASRGSFPLTGKARFKRNWLTENKFSASQLLNLWSG